MIAPQVGKPKKYAPERRTRTLLRLLWTFVYMPMSIGAVLQLLGTNAWARLARV